MTVLDYILDCVDRELQLERELGVRSVDCDRSVLKVEPEVRDSGKASRDVGSQPTTTNSEEYQFVFLHDRKLSENGSVMMSKIVTAMGKTPDSAPIVTDGSLPSAKVYIVLGGNALKKWFPTVQSGPGAWANSNEVKDIFVTYSPEYILKFGEVTPTVRKLKRDMWKGLQGVMQRLAL